MKQYLILLPLVFVLCCTHTPSKYKGYSTNNGTDYYKYSDLGSSHKHVHKGDVMEALINYSKMDGSVFWDSRDNGFPYSIFLPYDTLASGGSYQNFLLHANQGDSINFIVPAAEVFKNILHAPLPYFLHSGDMMKVNIRIGSIMNPEQFAAREKTIREYRKNMDMQEQLTLLQYVTVHHISDSAKNDGIYFIPISHGDGPQVKDKSLVSLSYKGYFLDGHIFDSVSSNNPLQFRYGDTAQVIKGLEIGIKKMRQGGQAKIIIPSQLAFGENGSSTGLVPPYTSVIYEVTMLKVTDPAKK